MAQWDEQLDKIKQVVKIMNEHNLVEIQIKQGEDEISVKKGQAQPQITAFPMIDARPQVITNNSQAPAGQSAATAQHEKLIEIKSPLVGTFYAQPSPDSEPFVEVGSPVDARTVVCIVEAMKVMNEIKAELNGTIAEVVAKNGQAVEYGQVLFRVRPE